MPPPIPIPVLGSSVEVGWSSTGSLSFGFHVRQRFGLPKVVQLLLKLILVGEGIYHFYRLDFLSSTETT
jgi:hypothetical protein